MDINNIDLQQLQEAVFAMEKKIKEMKKVIKKEQEERFSEMLFQNKKTRTENYNKKKVSEYNIEERETAYNKHKDLLAKFYLKFNGVASREQFNTLTSDNKAIDEIKEYGLCKVIHIWGKEVFILHSFSLSRMLDNKNAKTIRMTDNSIKYQLFINNWNIRNGKYDNVKYIEVPKHIELSRKGQIFKANAKNVETARYGFYTLPYLQFLLIAKRIGIGINIENAWKIEKFKINATQGKKTPVKSALSNYDKILKAYGYKGHFLFDIFRKGIINVNYVSVNKTVHFDYLDKTMNIGMGKVKILNELIEGLTNANFIDDKGQPVDVKIILNIHTSTSARDRLQKKYRPSGKSSVYVRFREFDYSL